MGIFKKFFYGIAKGAGITIGVGLGITATVVLAVSLAEHEIKNLKNQIFS